MTSIAAPHRSHTLTPESRDYVSLAFLSHHPGYRQPLLELDDELAQYVPGHRRPLATAQLVITVEHIPRGLWSPQPPRGHGGLGLLVLDGSLVRDCSMDEQGAMELLGPEDVIQPWSEPQLPDWLGMRAQWQALTPLDVAVLDRRFVTAAARWPEVLEELLARGLRRARLQVALRCVSRIRRLDDRVLVVLRILADRWGYVRGDGIHLRLKLTHELLSRLVGAHRPSVSTAIARLDRAGLLRRQGREFILPLEMPGRPADNGRASLVTARSAHAAPHSASARLDHAAGASPGRCADVAPPSSD